MEHEGWSAYPREMYALVEEKVPAGRLIARVVLTLLVLALGAWAYSVLHENAIRPLATRLSGIGTQQSQSVWLWAVIIVGFSGTVIAALFLGRKLSKARTSFVAVATHVATEVEPRITELEERAKRLETHTDIDGTLKEILAMARDRYERSPPKP